MIACGSVYRRQRHETLWTTARRRDIFWRGCGILVCLLSLSLHSLPLPAAAAESQSFTLEIRARKVVGASRTIRVQQGDTVSIRWSTDEPVSLHLHGYDIEQVIKPGTPTELSFKAHATGRFPITAHGFGDHVHKGAHGESTLLYVEVLPR
jgi:FtsP/CotA-like multicopper oxidase with cupredoxin domain